MPGSRKLTLRLISEKIHQLPLLPASVTRIIEMDEDSPEFFDVVTELAMCDPGLAIRVLQTVNSASNSPIQPITDVHQGLVHLGLNKTLQFISLLSVAKVFTPASFAQKSIWKHSLEVAHLSEFIASQMEGVKIKKGLAYSSGLLHDVGRLVLFEISARASEKIDTYGWSSPIELPNVENEILGFNHADVGYISAKKWGLPNVICELIHHHHNYAICQDPKVPNDFFKLVTIVQFADLISVMAEKNPTWRDWSKKELEKKIASSCNLEGWANISFPIKSIIHAMPEIFEQCKKSMITLHLEK